MQFYRNIIFEGFEPLAPKISKIFIYKKKNAKIFANRIAKIPILVRNFSTDPDKKKQ
jgi:hypothetical protein